jgi:hypothetical protein
MAIIYSYPQKTSVVADDTLVINDSADSNKTKLVTIQSIADFVDGEVTLQEVLNTGNRASSSGGGISTILLQDSTPTTTITLDGSTGDITANGRLNVNGMSTLATVNIDGGNIDGTVIGNTTIADGFFDTMRCSTADINGGAIDGTVIGATSAANGTFEDVTANGDISANGNLITNNSGILAVRSQGGLSLDANNGNNPTIDLNSAGGISIISEGSGDIVISPEFAGTGDILIGNNSAGEIDLTSETLDVNADSGITIDNLASGELNITQNSSANLNIQKTTSGNLNITSGGNIDIDSGDRITIAGPTVGKYIKVSKGSAGLPIPIGTAVYISGWNSGVTLVEACNPNDLTTMPSIGVVTDDVAFGQGATGEIIISGSHQFASGTIVPSGNPNDPLYVGTTGAITATRPVANNIRQKIGRILNNSGTDDEIYVNCVGILENESGTLSATIYQGSTPVTFNPAATSSGRWVYDGEIMSGFAKIDVPPQTLTQSFTNSFGVKFEITSGGSGNLMQTYQVNNNLPGKIDIVEAIGWDPPSSPYSGIIATTGPTAVATFQRPNTPDDYNLVNIPNWTIPVGTKILTLRFSYRVN